MGLRFGIWMPAVAVLIVLLSVSTILLYGLRTAKARLVDYSQAHALSQAVAAAAVLEATDPQEAKDALRTTIDTSGGQILLVDRQRDVVVREGGRLASPPPRRVLEAAAGGSRLNERIEGYRTITVPVIRDGRLRGGVVFVSGSGESLVLQIFSRSNVEAAALASVLGGGLMLLVAILLSRRVERLTLAAKSIERGDFSSRIEAGYGDELGELAGTFNAMAARVQRSLRQLEENNETLDAILDNLSEGVLATDFEGRVVFANLAARRMLNMRAQRDGGVGRPQELPNPFADFDLPDAVRRCARQRECGEARVEGEKTFFQIDLEHMPAFDDYRGGVLVVIRDLSESRRLEANQQRFLANAAHELKTPITTILGASELLLTETEDDPLVRERFLGHIRSEAERMKRLSETLLRLARTGWDCRKPDLGEVDLTEVAGRVAERMRPLAERLGLRLLLEGEGRRVRADEEWLEQALLVLMSNAAQHSKKGDSVRLRTEGPVVTVEDEGVGIGEEDLPYVFERFHRGSDSQGFGLGLTICKELIESMDGEISLHSEKGKGTRIEIRLPEARTTCNAGTTRG